MKKDKYFQTSTINNIASKKGVPTLGHEVVTPKRLKQYASIFHYLPNPDLILRKKNLTNQVYEELLTDSHVRSCLRKRFSGVKKKLWEIDRGKSKSKESKLVERIFNNSLSIRKTIDSALKFSFFGYQPIELIWNEKIIDSVKYIIPTALKPRSPKYFQFDFDGNVWFQNTINSDRELVNPMNIIIPSQESTDENPYGFADASTIFWWVFIKRNTLQSWLRFVEKYGIDKLIGKVPRGTDDEIIDNLTNKLSEMVDDAVATIYDDESVDVLENKNKTSSSAIFSDLLRFCNNEIGKALNGQNITSEQGQTGIYSYAKVGKETEDDIITDDTLTIQDMFDEIIKRIVDVNFGKKDQYPKFILYDPEDVDMNLATRDKTLIETGNISFTLDYFIEKYGFEEKHIIVSPPQSKTIQPVSEFAENQTIKEKKQDNTPEELKLIEELADSLSDDKLQLLLNETLKPVIDLINNSKDYETVQKKLASIYPFIPTKKIEKMLENLIFISGLIGRFSDE